MAISTEWEIGTHGKFLSDGVSLVEVILSISAAFGSVDSSSCVSFKRSKIKVNRNNSVKNHLRDAELEMCG